MKIISIIGGGLSGSLVVAQLIRKAAHPLKIFFVEKGEELGRGVAYGTSDLSHLLNVPAGKMSAFPEEPNHFLEWLNANGRVSKASDFISRKIYGDYIQSILSESTAIALKKGIVLEFINGEAVSTKTKDGKVSIRISNGQELITDTVVLSLGHFRALPTGGLQASLEKLRNYISFYWRSHAWRTIPTDAKILIIGSGLSMVDAVLCLKNRGHHGAILSLSRRGFLPKVHEVSPEWKPSKFLIESSSLRKLIKELRTEITDANRAGVNWRSVLDSLRPHLQTLWKRLTLKEKQQFLRHVRPYWEIHRHRMAPEVGEQIEKCIASKTLTVLSGRIQNIHEEGPLIHATLLNRHGDKQELSVNYIINCMGPESDMRKVDSPLISSLLEQKLIQFDPLRLGLATDDDGMLLSQNGCATPLFTLGALRKGELWETTAVPEIRVQASTLSEHLLKTS